MSVLVFAHLLYVCIRLRKEKNQQVVHVHSLSRKRSQIQESSEDGVQKEANDSGPDGNELRFERIRIQNMDIR